MSACNHENTRTMPPHGEVCIDCGYRDEAPLKIGRPLSLPSKGSRKSIYMTPNQWAKVAAVAAEDKGRGGNGTLSDVIRGLVDDFIED